MRFGRLLVLAAVLVSGCGDRDETASVPGSHARLECTACHAGPPTAEVVTPVAAGACAACHAADAIADTVTVENVSFVHGHPGPEGVGSATCSTCHTHEDGDAPLVIATSSCFLCHADLAPSGATQAVAALPEDRCATCHVQPTHTGFAQSGEPVDHATVLARGISCVLCHYDVVEGSGSVAQARCRDCHGRLGGPAPVNGADMAGNADALHASHLSGTVRLACVRCHDPVNHRVVKLASALVLDCTECHAPDDAALRPPLDSAAHRPTQQLYAGLVPGHPDVQPAIKFLERVSCDACHDVGTTHASGTTAIAAINRECVSCHGPRFGTLLGPWLAGVDAHSAAVSAYVARAVAAAGSADSSAAAAAGALRLVNSAHGVHNLTGADSLLRVALRAAGSAFRRAGMAAPAIPDLGPSPARESCVRCHYGIDTDPGTPPFEHGRHILGADLPCAECHGTADFFEEDRRTFNPAHGTIDVSPVECATCHHVETAQPCAECHSRTEVSALALTHDLTVTVPRGNVRNTRTVAFDHDAHAEMQCARCHDTPAPQRPAVECAECHTEHHDEVPSPAGCAQCHGTDVRDRHERVDHLACGACHTTTTLRLLGTADRAFCLQCHATQVDHEPGGECVQCHMQRSPESAMETIVRATVPPRTQGRRPN